MTDWRSVKVGYPALSSIEQYALETSTSDCSGSGGGGSGRGAVTLVLQAY